MTPDTKQIEINELIGRIKLCDLFIQALATIDDERQPDALAHYQAQKNELEIKLQQLEKADEKPAATFVELKTAVLFPKSGK